MRITSALLFAAFRFDTAALLFFGLVIASRAQWLPRTRDDIGLILTTGTLLIGMHFALLFLGQSYVTSSVAAIVLSFAPIITPALALKILPDERIRTTDVLGLLVGLAGVIAISTTGGTFSGRLVGIVLLLGAAVTFALGSVLAQRLPRTLPLASLQAWSMLAGAATLHTISHFHPMESISHVDWTASALAAITYLAIVCTVGGFLLYFTLLDRVGATNSSLISYATPIVAAVFGTALLGEPITVTMILGFALIVVGFALCKIRSLWRLARTVQRSQQTPPATETRTVRVNGNDYSRTDQRDEYTSYTHARATHSIADD
ncbi:DMT family transporter [Natronococcus wangiae]|uniref:DMT family transporter n=1 Tax=Natronococcus wangiae TaxID=3068275 RepID=UPI0031338D26